MRSFAKGCYGWLLPGIELHPFNQLDWSDAFTKYAICSHILEYIQLFLLIQLIVLLDDQSPSLNTFHLKRNLIKQGEGVT